MAPLPELTPEYLAEDTGPTLFNVSLGFVVLETLFVLLFFTARYLKKTLWKLDTLFITLAFCWTLGVTLLAMMMPKAGGAGRHFFVVASQDYPKFVVWLKIELAVQFCYLYGVTFPKLAILHLYLRIFNKKIFRQITYFVGGIVVLNAIVLTIVCFTICQPFEYNWNKFLPGGHCGDLYLLFRLVSFPNIVTDLIILLLPIPVIYRLHAKTGQKLGLALTFLTGSFGLVTAIIRLYHFFKTNLFDDPTFNSVTTMSWTVVEPGCYLIAAILPSLRPLLGYLGETKAVSYVRSRITNLTTRQRTRFDDVALTPKGQGQGQGQKPPYTPESLHSQHDSYENKIHITHEFIVQKK